VIAAGEGVQEFQPGDRVACGGGGYASHSAINFVPKNLAVKLPDSVGLDAAALTTIGAIAMQDCGSPKPDLRDGGGKSELAWWACSRFSRPRQPAVV